MKGSAALAAMIRKKSTVLYGQPGEDGSPSTSNPDEISSPPISPVKVPPTPPPRPPSSPLDGSETTDATAPRPKPFLNEIKVVAQQKEELKPVKYTPKTVTLAFNSTPKCTVCNKSVYKMEEMIAIGRVWHLDCFTCGVGSKEGGCGKVLKREGYCDHEGNPFCNICHARLFRPKGYGNSLSPEYGVGSGPVPMSPSLLSAIQAGPAKPPAMPEESNTAGNRKSLPRTLMGQIHGAAQVKAALKPVRQWQAMKVATPKCPICSKSVYKVEEVIAAGASWHASCFTCGGCNKASGCGKVLKRDAYVEHESNPYCQTCYAKILRP